jgi:regulatory protein
VTPEYLERAALHYLERHASSTANLRRVLMGKVRRSATTHGTDAEEGAQWVEALLTRYAAAGLLDDRAYAEMKVAGLHRRGGSTRTIRQKLAAKGVGVVEIDHALAQREEAVGEGDADLAAAIAFARRRRLGVFRPPGRPPDADPADAGEAADAAEVHAQETGEEAGEEPGAEAWEEAGAPRRRWGRPVRPRGGGLGGGTRAGKKQADRDRFDKDLAAMARAGFDLNTARRALAGDEPGG